MKLDTNKFGFIYDVLFVLLVFFIPLSTAIPNIILVLLGLLWLADFEKKSLLVFKRKSIAVLVAIVLFYGLTFLVASAPKEDWATLSKFLILLVVPILYIRVKDENMVAAAFTLGINLSIIISLIYVFMFYISEGFLPFDNSEYVNQILLMERPYFGFICLVNILISIQLISRQYFNRAYFFISIILSLTFILLITARLSIISIFILGILALIGMRSRLGSWSKFLWLIPLLVILGLFLNKNTLKRFYIEDSLDKSLKKISVYEPRVTIWECGIKALKYPEYNWMVGYSGFAQVNSRLRDCYAGSIENSSKKEYFLTEGFNSHNQFGDFLLSGGLIALFLITLFFALGFWELRANLWGLLILGAFLLFFSVENVLHRQLGCYLLGVFLAIYSRNVHKDESDQQINLEQ